MKDILKDYKFDVFMSPFDERDYIMEGIVNPKFDLPLKLDYRTEMPPAWDQGPDGACSAFAAAGMKQWQEYKNYNLDLKETLSQFFVYNLRDNYPSSGMYPRNTMNILKIYGIPLKKSFDRKWVNVKNIPEKVLDEAKNHIIQGYAKISTIDGLKKSLYKNGPCYGAFPVYNGGTSFWKPSFGKTKILGGHAVSIVGYNKKGFIIRNSWGTDWGDNGHTIYPYEDWGSHWELWSTIDDLSSEPVIIKKKTKLQKFFFWLVNTQLIKLLISLLPWNWFKK